MSSRCHSCGALIFWVRTAAGKRMPIDAEPSPEGNVILDEGRGVAIVLSKKGAEAVGGPRYLSHFATCPKADEHRRR